MQANGRSLDSSFGQRGIITTDLTGYSKDYFAGLALYPDGKIVGFGNGEFNTRPAGVYLARYNANAATGIQYATPTSITSLAVYPNPTRSQLFLSGIAIDQIASIQIAALDGRMLRAISAPLSTSIPVSSYPPGIYMLRIVQKNGASSYRSFVITQ